MEFIKENIEDNISLGYISKKSNIKDIKDNSDIKTIISFKEFRQNHPNWGENIEEFLVNSDIFSNLKNKDIVFEKEHKQLIIESGISII